MSCIWLLSCDPAELSHWIHVGIHLCLRWCTCVVRYNDEWAQKEGEMRALLAKGKIPIADAMQKGEIDHKTYFGGPLSRHGQQIGFDAETKGLPRDGYWNDVREDEMWCVHTQFHILGLPMPSTQNL